jgi:hypothetical protein
MNQKLILFPRPRIFQPPSLPPKSSPPTYLPPSSLPSYLLHLISHSLHLESSLELVSFSLTNRCDIGLEEGGSSTLQECGEEKERGMLQKQKQEKKGKLPP